MTGSELKEIRIQLGLTQTELGNEMGKDLSTIQRWETSKEDLPIMVELSLEALEQRLKKRKRPIHES